MLLFSLSIPRQIATFAAVQILCRGHIGNEVYNNISLSLFCLTHWLVCIIQNKSLVHKTIDHMYTTVHVRS